MKLPLESVCNNRTKWKKQKILKYKFLTFEDWIEFETICIAEHKMQTKFESSMCFAESFTHLKFESKHFSRFVYNCNRFLSHFMKLDFFPHLHYFRLDLCLSLLLVVLFMSNAASFKIDFQCSRRSSNRWENAFQPQFNSFCSTQLNLVDDTNMFLDDFVLFVTYFDDNLPFGRYASSCAVLLASELTW